MVILKKIKKRETSFGIIFIIRIITIFITIFFFATTPILAQYKIGAPVPDFTLEDLDGEVFQLNQFLNKQQHLLLFFVHSDEMSSIAKLEDMIAFFSDYQPRESYQIIAIIEQGQDTEIVLERLSQLKEKKEIPLIILLDVEGEVSANYEIASYPTILLLRVDLHLRRAYDRFTTRQEASFYQYLKFIFTSQKSKDTGNGCSDDVCPPPPGFE